MKRTISSLILAALVMVIIPIQADYSIKNGFKGLASLYKTEPKTSLCLLGMLAAGVAGARYMLKNDKSRVTNPASRKIIQHIHDVLNGTRKGCISKALRLANTLPAVLPEQTDKQRKVVDQVTAYKTLPLDQEDERAKKRAEILALKDELYPEPTPKRMTLARVGVIAGLASLAIHSLVFNDEATKAQKYLRFPAI